MRSQYCLWNKTAYFRVAITGLLSVIVALSLIIYFPSETTQAQTNTSVNFQGKIVRNDTGNEGLNVTTSNPACVLSGADTCDFQIVYYDAASGGNTLGTETFLNQEIGARDGIFNLALGTGTYTAGTESTFLEIFNDNSTVYAEMKFAPGGAGSYTETFSRMAVRAAPFALNSSNLDGLDSTNFVKLAPSGVQADSTTSSSIFINKTGGSGNILQLQKNGSDALVLDNNGYLGIGTIGGAKLNVSKNSNNSNTDYGISSTNTITHSVDEYKNYINLRTDSSYTGTQDNTLGMVNNIYSAVNKFGTSTLNRAWSNYSIVSTSAGHTNDVAPFVSTVSQTAGTIGTASGITILLYGGGTGTISTGYGVYIGDVNATSDYGIYQVGSNDSNYFAGNLGIGDTSPASALTVGNGDLFQVDSSGDLIKIRNVTYTWPSSQGGANTVLTNNGSGTLSWGTLGAASIADDSLDFIKFEDTLDLDDNLTLNQSTYSWTQTYGGTGTGLSYSSSTITSGSLMSLSTTSTTAASNTQKVLNISTSGANATSTQTTYGSYITNTHTGTSSTNIAGYFSATGGTANYALDLVGNVRSSSGSFFGLNATNARIVITDSGNDDIININSAYVGIGRATPEPDSASADATDSYGVLNVSGRTYLGSTGGNSANVIIGSDSSSSRNNQLLLTGNFSALNNAGSLLQISSIGTAVTNLNFSGANFNPGLATAASGTHSLFTTAYFDAGSITNNGATVTNSATVYIEGAWSGASTNYSLLVDSGNVRFDGQLDVGSSQQFSVNSSGNLTKVNNITYSWPSAQAGGSGYVLTNNGSGTLTWVASGAAGIGDDTLDFNKFEDTLDLDDNLTLNQSTYSWTQTYGGTGTGLSYTTSTITSGNLLSLSSTSTAATANTQTVLNVSTSGANATATQTTYGAYITNTHTGTTSTNVAGYFSASGGTNNYAGIFANGYVGIGTTTPLATLHVVGNITNPGTGASSEQFGFGSNAQGSNTLAIGRNASTGTNDSAIAIGDSASAAGQQSLAVGRLSSAAGIRTIAIGNSAGSTGNESVGIGTSSSTQNEAIAIGAGSSSVSGSVSIGHSAAASGGAGIAIGRSASAGANQFVAGSSSYAISNLFFGKGVTNATPTSFTINGTGGSGTDIAGANIEIAGGKATGNAVGGGILFMTSNAGSSGTTLQSITEKMRLTAAGNLGIGDTSPTALLTVGSGDAFQVNSSGAIAAATGITSSGTVTFSGLTADRMVSTTTGGQLTTSISSANLALSITDEQGTAGNVVFSGSPTITTPTFTTSATTPMVIGGTGTTSTLTFKTTTNTGASGADMIFQVGNNGGTEAMRILNSGNVGIRNSNPGALLDIGTAGSVLGTMRLAGNTSGYVQIQPSAAAGSYTLTLPTTDGNTNEVLQTNGSGVLSWVAPSAGTVTGTGTNGYNAYWTGTSSLGSEQYVALTRGGTGTTLTASNGGIVYSNATTLAVLAGTATANRVLMSGASTTPAWSTATYPSTATTTGTILRANGTNWVASTATYPGTGGTAGTILRSDGTNWVNTTATYPATTTINQILYSSAANVVSGITSVNSAVLLTNGSGVPSFTAITTDTFTQYALLAGRSGAQTLTGSTATNTGLTLRATSNASATTGADIIFQVGNSGGTEAMRILNAGGVRVKTNLGILESGGTPTYYTILQGGDQTGADITYTLPTSSSNGLLRNTGGVWSWDTNTYLTGNQSISLTGEVTGTGTTSISTTIANNIVNFTEIADSLTLDAATSLAQSTYAWTQTYGGTGTGLTYSTSTITSGSLLSLSSTSTAAASNTQKVLNISTSGANSTATQTTYGSYITNTHTGTTSTNVAAYFSASGGTNNYAGIFANGNVGIGTTTPSNLLSVGSSSQFQVSSTGAIAAATGITSSGTINFSAITSGGLNTSVLALDGSNNVDYIDLSGNLVGTGTTGQTVRHNGTSWVAASNLTNDGTDVTLTGDFLPGADDTYDLGSSSARWRDLYLGPNSIKMGDSNGEAIFSYDYVTDRVAIDAGINTTNALVGTVIGGTTTTSSLTFKTTTAVGIAGADMIFQVGNNGGTEAMRILNSGNVGIRNNNPGALLDIGTAGSVLGTMRLAGNTSGYVQIQPSAAAGSYTLTLPTTDGNSNEVLQTNGSGVLSWVAQSSGTLSIANIGSSPNAQGGSASALQLTLQPADATYGGVVTATTQTFAGAKTFNGGVIIAGGQNLTMNSGTGVFSQAFTGTTTNAFAITANSLTTGNALNIASSSLTSGSLVSLSSTSTGAASNTQTILNIATSGANGTSTQTTYGSYITNTKTGTSSTNVAGYFSASGGTNNYALQVGAGHIEIPYQTRIGQNTHNTEYYFTGIDMYASNDFRIYPRGYTDGSHPEDNYLKVWSSGQLTIAGYDGDTDALGVGLQLTGSSASTWIFLNSNLDFEANVTDYAAVFQNASTNAAAHGLQIQLEGTTSGTSGNEFIAFVNDGETKIGRIRYGASTSAVVYSTTGTGDFAEWVLGEESMEPGDIVAFQGESYGKADRGETLAGIYSTYGAFVAGEKDANNPNAAMLALSGITKVKVNTSNGPIKNGDPITISNTNGVGMKATEPGQIVAIASEDYSNPDPAAVGMIHVVIALTWYDPGAVVNTAHQQMFDDYESGLLGGSMNPNGDLSVSGDLTLNGKMIVGDGTGTLQIDGGLDVDSIISESIDTAQLTALSIGVGEIDANLGLFDSVKTTSLNVGNGILLANTTGVEVTGEFKLNGILSSAGGVIEVSSKLKGVDGRLEVEGTLAADSLESTDLKVKNVEVDRTDVAGASAGVSNILAGELTTVIETNAVDSDSLVFVTLKTELNGANIFIEEQVDGSFTVKLSEIQVEDVEFNWLIVQ